jgi:Na+-transporting methylmalonyl-CoA/oxaloacetate decarboxylase gamma subunit
MHRVNSVNAWWQHVSATVVNGLQITIVGMTLVFLTLGLVIVALILLKRLPGTKQPKTEQDVATHTPSANVVTGLATDSAEPETKSVQDIELAQVAAIAVALLRSRRTKQHSRPRSEDRTSRWKQYGRAHQLGL